MSPTAVPILLVEDEETDVELLSHAFARAPVRTAIQIANNGEEAVEYLSGRGKFADRARHPIPKWIVTDLKMPQMDGFELLRWMGLHPRFRLIPKIVLTSSSSAADVQKAYEYGANAYFIKPVSFPDRSVIAEHWRLALAPEHAHGEGR